MPNNDPLAGSEKRAERRNDSWKRIGFAMLFAGLALVFLKYIPLHPAIPLVIMWAAGGFSERKWPI